MTTLVCEHFPVSDGEWTARCELHPAWRPKPTTEYTPDAMEKSLRRFHAKALSVDHMIRPGVPDAA